MKVLDINLEQFEAKKALVQKLKSMGLPTPKTEHYRYFGIKPIFDKEYEFVLPQSGSITEGDHIEIIDGVVTKAPKEVYIEILKNTKVDDSHYDQIYYLNHLFVENIIHIEAQEDLKIVHKFTKSGVFTPYRVKISVEENSNIKIYEESLILSQDSLYFYGYDIDLAPYSSLQLIQNRVSNFETFSLIGSHTIQAHTSSNFELFTFDFGLAKTVHNYHILLEDEAKCEANHVIFAKEEAKLGNTFHIEHKGKNSSTRQFSRNVLKDKAKGIFDGLLIVKNSAKYSSIYQDSKTVLLNDGAYMISKPQMEIYTEFIQEATHGSTTGHINEEALFYLQQRGIAKEEAKEILVLSFLNEIFEKLGDESIKKEFIELYEEQR